MAVSQILINRPGLGRTLTLKDLADPVGFFAVEHAYLDDVLGSLDAVAADLHLADRHERADGIVDYLRMDLPLHIEDEVATMELIEYQAAAPVGGLTDDMRDEHVALARLLPPVIDGLEEVSALGLPLAPSRFAIASLVLSEFMRLHVSRVRYELMPLAAATLTAQELEYLSREMAFRRGMGPTTSGGQTEMATAKSRR